MSNRRTCSECGALLSEDLPQGPCPVCVAQGALALPGGGSAGVIAVEPGEQIGPSKVLNKLGDGGIGFLLLAKQAEPLRRRVALKVNKPAQAGRKRWMCAGHPVVGEAISAPAAALERQARLAEAATNRRDASPLRQILLPADWLTFDARCRLGGILVGRKAFAEDEPGLLSGYRGVKEHEVVIPSPNKPRLKEDIQSIVRLYEATGRLAQAAEWKIFLVSVTSPDSLLYVKPNLDPGARLAATVLLCPAPQGNRGCGLRGMPEGSGLFPSPKAARKLGISLFDSEAEMAGTVARSRWFGVPSWSRAGRRLPRPAAPCPRTLKSRAFPQPDTSDNNCFSMAS